MSNCLFAIVDTETSGLNPLEHELLEINITPCDDLYTELKEYTPFHIRIKAEKPCDPRALAVNKLDPTVGVSREEALQALRSWMEKQGITSIRMIAQYHTFDFNFFFLFLLQGDFWALSKIFFREMICTKSVTEAIRVERRRRGLAFPKTSSLVNSSAFYSVSYEGAHKADRDCEITGEMMRNQMTSLIFPEEMAKKEDDVRMSVYKEICEQAGISLDVLENEGDIIDVLIENISEKAVEDAQETMGL